MLRVIPALLLGLFSVAVSPASAQRITLGAEAGLNMSTILSVDKRKAKPAIGFSAGGVINVPLSKRFSLEPGLYYVQKGYRTTYVLEDYYFFPQDEGDFIKSRVRLSYLQLPVRLQIKVASFGGNHIFTGVGPYIATGISGKGRVTVEPNNQSFTTGTYSNRIRFGSDRTFRHIDAGAGLNIGFMSKMGLFARAEATIGLIDILPPSNRRYYGARRHATGCLSVGYLFGKK